MINPFTIKAEPKVISDLNEISLFQIVLSNLKSLQLYKLNGDARLMFNGVLKVVTHVIAPEKVLRCMFRQSAKRNAI